MREREREFSKGSDGLFGGSETLEGDFSNGLYGHMDFLMDCKLRCVYGQIKSSLKSSGILIIN